MSTMKAKIDNNQIFEDPSEAIFAKNMKIGENVEIGVGTTICGPDGGEAKYIEIGDNTFIGKNSIIQVPELVLGDYIKLHHHALLRGHKPARIGHNCWIGQNCILDSMGGLNIGNNVGIGAYSQIWTHILFGDTLEGCRFRSTTSTVIEDDVWFVGHCIVSPIRAEKKSMALVGSVITKEMLSNHIYGGVPARDLTPSMGFQFNDISIDTKFKKMIELKSEFIKFNRSLNPDLLKIAINYDDQPVDTECTVFNITDRSYIKKRSKEEIAFMKFLLYDKAKFLPHNNP
jgi:acetyltransferase-like isoleucine patch superfamily enzyme